MNLKEIEKLQNEQKESDFQNLKKLEEENQILKSQITALKEVLTQEESEKNDMFNQLLASQKAIKLCQFTSLKKSKLIVTLVIVILFTLIILIIK